MPVFHVGCRRLILREVPPSLGREETAATKLHLEWARLGHGVRKWMEDSCQICS